MAVSLGVSSQSFLPRWLFRKRSFAVSGDLYELLQAEIKKSSKGVFVQVDL